MGLSSAPAGPASSSAQGPAPPLPLILPSGGSAGTAGGPLSPGTTSPPTALSRESSSREPLGVAAGASTPTGAAASKQQRQAGRFRVYEDPLAAPPMSPPTNVAALQLLHGGDFLQQQQLASQISGGMPAGGLLAPLVLGLGSTLPGNSAAGGVPSQQLQPPMGSVDFAGVQLQQQLVAGPRMSDDGTRRSGRGAGGGGGMS